MSTEANSAEEVQDFSAEKQKVEQLVEDRYRQLKPRIKFFSKSELIQIIAEYEIKLDMARMLIIKEREKHEKDLNTNLTDGKHERLSKSESKSND